MKKKLLLLLIAFFCLFSGCVARQDWIYTQLPNEYELWKINKEEYHLGKRKEESLIIEENKIPLGVKGKITEFTVYEDRYIHLKLETKEYYVVDTKEQSVYGPLNEEEIDYKLTALGIVERHQSISTEPPPEGVEYK